MSRFPDGGCVVVSARTKLLVPSFRPTSLHIPYVTATTTTTTTSRRRPTAARNTPCLLYTPVALWGTPPLLPPRVHVHVVDTPTPTPTASRNTRNHVIFLALTERHAKRDLHVKIDPPPLSCARRHTSDRAWRVGSFRETTTRPYLAITILVLATARVVAGLQHPSCGKCNAHAVRRDAVSSCLPVAGVGGEFWSAMAIDDAQTECGHRMN